MKRCNSSLVLIIARLSTNEAFFPGGWISTEFVSKKQSHSNTWDGRLFGAVVEESSPISSINCNEWYSSHISELKSYNLGGVVDPTFQDITIPFGNIPNLVAVTGETGSGKSLLIAKVADLVTGGKAAISYIPALSSNYSTEENQASVEMVLKLSEPHLSAVQESFENNGLDPSSLFLSGEDGVMGSLVLKRIMSVGDTKNARQRLKSACEINGTPVTLKTLKSIASPLVAIVDAAAAASALSRPVSRIAIVDSGISPELLDNVRSSRSEYRRYRKKREMLERELASRVLPPSYRPIGDDLYSEEDPDLELLQHWIDELDKFEDRMMQFCQSIQLTTGSCDSSFEDIASALTGSFWMDGEQNESSSSMYANLVEFREAVKGLDEQAIQAQNARDSLAALSAPDSAATALQRARNCLYNAVGGSSDNEGPVSVAAENIHDILNRIEADLEECVSAIEDDSKGLMQVLERTRKSVDLSIEDIDQIIAEWNVLARKHGISPYNLPACHLALRSELDGNVEARLLLPKAIEEEKEALDNFEHACEALTIARQDVSNALSSSVTHRLPSLGMDSSLFEARLRPRVRKCTDASAYGGGSGLGLDVVDFLLLHDQDENTANGSHGDENDTKNGADWSNQRGGKVDVVASAGEKARILLAIETELPGSIGASCSSMDSAGTMGCPPVAVIYDEIDAHVGGRAAVSLANMLADQTRGREGSCQIREQVISITHSPSVAAIADLHIVLQKAAKSPSDASARQDRLVPVLADVADAQARRKELARMASGDLATDEAEVFADALIREGIRQRNFS